jgi:hypothetical protein
MGSLGVRLAGILKGVDVGVCVDSDRSDRVDVKEETRELEKEE